MAVRADCTRNKWKRRVRCCRQGRVSYAAASKKASCSGVTSDFALRMQAWGETMAAAVVGAIFAYLTHPDLASPGVGSAASVN